jgi:hypothetical protein
MTNLEVEKMNLSQPPHYQSFRNVAGILIKLGNESLCVYLDHETYVIEIVPYLL